MQTLSTPVELLQAASTGTEQWWNALYQKYYPFLYATALHLCNDPSSAQDLVQDTFVTAYLKLSQLKEMAAFGGWVKKILVHTYYRSQKSKAPLQHSHQLPIESEQWWEDEFSKQLEQLSDKSKLYSVVTCLPEALRSTLLLRYFSTFQSYEEIGSILSIPVGTVRSRLNQAKLKLLEYWQQQKTDNTHLFKESEEQNHFYYAMFTGMHEHDDCKNRFICHLHKGIQLLLPGSKPQVGSSAFERKIVDDRQAGSWLIPTNVVSYGNTSVIEVKHFNSKEYPHHCPNRSVLILYRTKGKVSKMHLYI